MCLSGGGAGVDKRPEARVGEGHRTMLRLQWSAGHTAMHLSELSTARQNEQILL